MGWYGHDNSLCTIVWMKWPYFDCLHDTGLIQSFKGFNENGLNPT
jgi:hypothetical protein